MTDLFVKRYDPFWLHDLSKGEREEVVDWVVTNGVDPEMCAGFDVTFSDINQVRCKIYRKYQGKPIWNPENNSAEYDRDQVFSTRRLPAAIWRDHPANR